MKVTTLTVGGLGTNCYIAENGNECAVIDPGANIEKILRELRDKKVKYILLTHGHFDHILACAELCEKTQAKIYLHPADKAYITPEYVSRYRAIGWLDEDYIPFEPDGELSEGMELPLGESVIKVLHTPGHSGGSCSFLCGEILFSGDTLFCESFGRCDLDGGDMEKMQQSVSRLLKIPGDIKVLPGHGETTTLNHERIFNPLARCI